MSTSSTQPPTRRRRADHPRANTAIELVPPATGSRAPDQLLATRLATAPGLVRAGAGRWDDGRTPIQPLSVESAYADPLLLRDLPRDKQ